MRARNTQSGFTLLEVLLACAIIGILATVVVPSLFGETRKTRGLSEVQTVFSDLRSRMDQFAMETGRLPASLGEGVFHPTAPVSSGAPISPMPQAWIDAKVRLTNPNAEVSCAYTWVTGAPNDDTAIGSQATAFGFTDAPATSWYYLLAWCDLDDDNTLDSYYFSSSVDPTILKRNEGT